MSLQKSCAGAFFALAVALGGSVASASIVIDGDILEGNSWGQKFKDTCTQSFSAMQIAWTDTPVGTSFESISFAQAPGWSVVSYTPTAPLYSPFIVATSATYTNELPFTLWFTGNAPTSKLNFSVKVGHYSGTTFVQTDSTGVGWNGSHWSVNSYNPPGESDPVGNPVPEPGAIIIWSILGVAGIAASLFRKRGAV